MKKIGIVMGSDSDLPVVKKAADMLKSLDIPFEAHVYSAHRTPEEARTFALNARRNGFGVLIAAAGMAAQILAVEDEALAARLDALRAEAAAKVLEKDEGITARL